MLGGWRGDATSAFTGLGLSAVEKDAQSYLRALLNWRKRTPLLHTGKLTHFAPADGVYVYFRHDTGKAVMVALNKNARATSLQLDRFDGFLRGRGAREALSGRSVVLGKSLSLPGKSATLVEIE